MTEITERYLRTTRLLNCDARSIQLLVESRGWRQLPPMERIGAIYQFTRDEIRFGYNLSDDIPASDVLRDGYGQCNTKTTLLMALLRASGVSTRFHGAIIHKRLQRGIVNGAFYALAPTSIAHSWVEVLAGDRWCALEGVIVDRPYMRGLRAKFPNDTGAFLGYGVGTECFAQPAVDWNGGDTFIQRTGVNHDFGVFDDPDAFYEKHSPNLTGLKWWLFRHWVRHVMNRNVQRIRAKGAGSST